MLKYISNKGGGKPVNFETAILNGFASDGGLYVPEKLPKISKNELKKWKGLGFKDVCFEIVSLFIDREIISSDELKIIIDKSYDAFEVENAVTLYKLKSREQTYIMELFHGPTLSFKDIGQSFLVNLLDFLLKRKKESLSIIVATTGDTGPAAANYIAGKSSLDAWILYPKGLITEEQERQMTTLHNNNIHPVGVYNCPEGGDNLDTVISKLYSNKKFKKKVKLSSINSINWGRIIAQMTHYFYGYLKVADYIGEDINISVPSGGFGNLCAGGFARKMGLPIKNFIIANNKNESLNRIFRNGVISKDKIHETISSAIDIITPYNFWRYLYFCNGQNSKNIKKWSNEFETKGEFHFDDKTFKSYRDGFLSFSVSDKSTIGTIKSIYENENYLLDPHGSVAISALNSMDEKLSHNKTICLATAHPAKFPKVILKSLNKTKLPEAGKHKSIEGAKKKCQKGYHCDYSNLEKSLLNAIETNWERSKKIIVK
jgi:threonine synthase